MAARYFQFDFLLLNKKLLRKMVNSGKIAEIIRVPASPTRKRESIVGLIL